MAYLPVQTSNIQTAEVDRNRSGCQLATVALVQSTCVSSLCTDGSDRERRWPPSKGTEIPLRLTCLWAVECSRSLQSLCLQSSPLSLPFPSLSLSLDRLERRGGIFFSSYMVILACLAALRDCFFAESMR